MAALEHRVLTGILRTRDMSEALASNLVAKEFKDAESREIYQHIYRWWHNSSTHKSVPTVASIRRKWPAFEPTATDPDEDGELRSLIHELKMRAFDSDMRGLADYFSDLVETDPEDAIESLKRALDDLDYRMNGGTCLNLMGIAEHTLQHYEDAQNGDIMGIPWPWDILTEDTMGKRPGDFIVFYGRMKSMKTWLLLFCAAFDYMMNNRRVLIWSREMGEESIALRLASIMCSVDYQLLKKGKLPPKLKERTLKMLQAIEDERVNDGDGNDLRPDNVGDVPDIIVLAGQGSPTTTDELRGAIQTYQPEIVYADSFYHLRSSRESSSQRWQQVAALAEDLKQMAQDFNIPVVATTQANRAGEKVLGGDLTEVADADNIAREADLIIRVIKRRGKELHEHDYEVRDKEEGKARPKKKKGKLKLQSRRRRAVPKGGKPPDDDKTPRQGAELALILGGNRDGVLEAFTIHAVPGYNFNVIDSSFSSSEVKAWVETDNKRLAAEEKGSKIKTNQWSPKTFAGTRDKSEEDRKYKKERMNK